MGYFFSDAVEQALRDIYYEMGAGRGQEGFRLLEEASNAGDGDASCLLARCLCGSQYVWEGHQFPEDDRRATKLLRKAVEQGSALAVLVCLRTGDMTPSLQQKMPFSSLQEAFDMVLDKAERGEPFCQYTIGNSYFWWDFLRIQGKSKNDFSSHEAFRDYLRENITKCEDWFWRAFRNGVFWGGNNLKHYYWNGDEDIVPPQPEKAADINRIGAEYGYPNYQYYYGYDLWRENRKEEAFPWMKKAYDHGQTEACFYVGYTYEWGTGVEKDLAKAAACYTEGIQAGKSREGCSNRWVLCIIMEKAFLRTTPRPSSLSNGQTIREPLETGAPVIWENAMVMAGVPNRIMRWPGNIWKRWTGIVRMPSICWAISMPEDWVDRRILKRVLPCFRRRATIVMPRKN